MLPLVPISLEQKEKINAVLAAEDSMSADFSFGNMFLWDGKYRQSLCIVGSRLVVLVEGGRCPIFPFPVGSGELLPVLEAMNAHAAGTGCPLIMRGLEKRHVETLEALCPGKFRFEHDRDYDDYIYSLDKLSTLSGKKLHGKRNHCKRFETMHSWECRPLSRELFPLCRELLSKWESVDGRENSLVSAENAAIERAFEHFEALGLEGAALFAGDRLCAFAIGEALSSRCFDIHFEKADPDTDGAYAMINREFARLIAARHPDLHYVNREDDMGLENLRFAKLSYRPEMILEKYSATYIEEVI